jgi:hypothetical protein
LPQRRRQVGHFGNRVRALREEPFSHLLAAIIGTRAEIPFFGKLVEQQSAQGISHRKILAMFPVLLHSNFEVAQTARRILCMPRREF